MVLGITKRLRSNDETLTELFLSKEYMIEDDDLFAIINSLRDNTQLKKLTIVMRNVGDNCMRACFDSLSYNCGVSTLIIIVPYGTNIFYANQLIDLLEKNKFIKNLFVTDRAGGSNAYQILESLASNTSLRYVNITFTNAISADGLLELLNRNTTITNLTICGPFNSIPHNARQQFENALANNTTLTKCSIPSLRLER